MITFLPFCFNPVELAHGALTNRAEVHVAFTSFSTPLPRCCPFQSRTGWTSHKVCNPEDEKNYSTWGSIFLQLSRDCFRCGLTILWHGYIIALGILLPSSLWVNNIRITVFPLELLIFQETFPGMAISWPFLCSIFCLSSKVSNISFSYDCQGYFTYPVGELNRLYGKWLRKQFQARSESNLGELGLMHNRLSISQLSWWTKGHPAS